MGSRRSSQTPDLLCETVWQADETGGTVLADPISTQRSQSCFFPLILFLTLLLVLHLNFELVNLLMDVWFGCLRDFLLQNLASFGKNIIEVRSKYASAHACYPMLTSSNCLCGIWSLSRSPLTAEPLSQAIYYLLSREQGSMPTQFSIAFAASTNSIRVYLGSRLALGTWR